MKLIWDLLCWEHYFKDNVMSLSLYLLWLINCETLKICFKNQHSVPVQAAVVSMHSELSTSTQNDTVVRQRTSSMFSPIQILASIN